MGVGAQGILGDFQSLNLSPGSIRTGRGDDLGKSGRGWIGDALGEIHLLAIGSEAAGSLIIVGIQTSGDGFRSAPFSLVVFFRIEDVASLGSGDSAEFISLCVVAGGGEVDLFVFIAQEHR